MRELEYLVTGSEMQAYDTYTIEKIGIPAMVLMERAALGVRDRVLLRKEQTGNGSTFSVLCVCGTGNNGGDGLCLARLLADQGICVRVALIGNRAHLSREAEAQCRILKEYGIALEETVPEEAFDVVVDAMLGTGLSRELTGGYRDAVETVNSKSTYRIAVDLPSGIQADTGRVMGTAVEAQETVCLGFLKRGVFRYPGAQYAGNVSLQDIGITARSLQTMPPGMYTRFGRPEALLPGRRRDGNKGTFGKLLLVAGSENMAGAAILAAESAVKTGVGMVKLVIPEKLRTIIQTRLPEALIQVYGAGGGITEEEQTAFKRSLEWADAAAVGPGLSQSESGAAFLKQALLQDKPLVIDADGLNLLAAKSGLQELLIRRGMDSGRAAVLTPHMGELARLLGKPVCEVTAAETECTRKAAQHFCCVVAGKSARTCVSDGKRPDFLNTAGNDKMATAGSGDVLTGMIASLLAQGMEPFAAAECGVYLHAIAGDRAAENTAAIGLLASEMTEHVRI